MSIARPFFRTYRLFDASGSDDYVLDPRFAGDRAAVRPQHAVRAFVVLQSDLRQLFEFIEPADDSFRCYLLRVHSLLGRVSTTVGGRGRERGRPWRSLGSQV